MPAAIRRTDLVEYADRPCSGYSGGNKRKLSTALALLAGFAVLRKYVLEPRRANRAEEELLRVIGRQSVMLNKLRNTWEFIQTEDGRAATKKEFSKLHHYGTWDRPIETARAPSEAVFVKGKIAASTKHFEVPEKRKEKAEFVSPP